MKNRIADFLAKVASKAEAMRSTSPMTAIPPSNLVHNTEYDLIILDLWPLPDMGWPQRPPENPQSQNQPAGPDPERPRDAVDDRVKGT